MKRERTTSITRLRTVSDAAREGVISIGDKVSVGTERSCVEAGHGPDHTRPLGIVI
jgi:hypothetical protein